MYDQIPKIRFATSGLSFYSSGRFSIPDFSEGFDECGIRPFLKWTGGKQWLSKLFPIIEPENYSGGYFEPFLGGGACFFNLDPYYARLSDENEQLISTYRAIRDSVDKVICKLKSLPNDKNCYLRIRSSRPSSDVNRAVRLIYLNKTAFNGIYRVNQNGEYNVPFGKYANPTICQSDRLRAASDALRGVDLAVEDFRVASGHVQGNDLVYFDPPYITGHTNNGFIKYNAHLFDWDDQEDLAQIARGLARQGSYVVVSQAPFKPVVDLYKGFHLYGLERNSLVSSRSESRRRVTEVLLASFPLFDFDSEVV